MMAAVNVIDNNRLRAALAVLTLNTADRAWLEGQLSAAEKEKLAAAMTLLDDQEMAGWMTQLEGEPVNRNQLDSCIPYLYCHADSVLAVIAQEPDWMLPAMGRAFGTTLCQQLLQHAVERKYDKYLLNRMTEAWEAPVLTNSGTKQWRLWVVHSVMELIHPK